MEDQAFKIFSMLEKRDGFQLAQVRFVTHRSENINFRMGIPFNSNRLFSRGIGIRVRANHAWGFASTDDLSNSSILLTAKNAWKVAKASAQVPRFQPVELVDEPVYEDNYSVVIKKDPFKMDLQEKAEVIEAANKLTISETDVIRMATASYNCRDQLINFFSSDGNKIEQRIMMIGADVNAVGIGTEGPQTRNIDMNETGGWEAVEKYDFMTTASSVKKEAIELATTAQKCPKDFKGTLILDPWQLGLTIHESCGHPSELDRVLGYEADFAGTSWLTPEKLNTLKYGNELVNITQDPTISGILGHFKYDDEGVKARSISIIKDGLFVGYQSDREYAAMLGLKQSSGNSRAENYNDIPIIRMNSLYLESPKSNEGYKDIGELIADTPDGIYGIRYKSHSIDDKRLNFQFSAQIGYRIEHGEITKTLKDISYQAITPEFWGACSGLTRTSELHGYPNCGKGSPNMQTGFVAHGGPWGRFEDVHIGVV